MKDKHLIFVYNRQLFKSDKFEEETFDKISYMDWIPLDVVNTAMHHYTIQIQTLMSQDQYWLSPS